MKNKTKLAVFDLDGTLFDTDLVNCCSYQKAAEECGYFLEKEKFLQVFTGKNYREFLPLFGIVDAGVQEKIHEKKKRYYAEFLPQAKKNQHLFSMIRELRGGYMIALATTASKRNAMELLACFGETETFDFFITQEDVRKLKPDPECYLMAMEKAEVAACDTIIFEDSEVGMMAARASGAYAFLVDHF